MKRALSFLLRAVVGVTAVYLLWIPLAEPTLVVVARAAEGVLSWVVVPPLVTGLEVSGEAIDIRGLLYHPGQWMGRWAAGNLPIFIIASLGLSLAVPVRGLAERAVLVGSTILACFVAMVAIGVIEVQVVAVTWAAARERLTLLSAAERSFIARAHGAMDLVQMLLPATLAVVAYGLLWARDSREPSPGPRPRTVAFVWIALVVVVGLLMLPPSSPSPRARLARFAETANRNPDSAKAWLAYARAAQLVSGAPGAAAAYARAGANGADGHAVRIGIAQSLLAEGELERALAAAQAALRSGPPSPALAMVEANALLRSGRACEARDQLRARIAARSGRQAAPGLVRALRAAERACARAVPGSG